MYYISNKYLPRKNVPSDYYSPVQKSIEKLVYVRFGKLVKTQDKPCCISKAMGIHFPHPIFMSIFEKKKSCYMKLLRPQMSLDSRYCQEDMKNLTKE